MSGAAWVGQLTAASASASQGTDLLSRQPAALASAVNLLRWVSGTVGEKGSA